MAAEEQNNKESCRYERSSSGGGGGGDIHLDKTQLRLFGCQCLCLGSCALIYILAIVVAVAAVLLPARVVSLLQS